MILVVVCIYLLLIKYRRTSTGKFRLYDDIIDAWSSPAVKDPSDLPDSGRPKSRRLFRSRRPKTNESYETGGVTAISVKMRRLSNEYSCGPPYESPSTFSTLPSDPASIHASQTVSILTITTTLFFKFTDRRTCCLIGVPAMGLLCTRLFECQTLYYLAFSNQTCNNNRVIIPANFPKYFLVPFSSLTHANDHIMITVNEHVIVGSYSVLLFPSTAC